MTRVLLTAPNGKTTGGISRWTKHVLGYYATVVKNDCELEILSTERPDFTQFAGNTFKRIWIGLFDYFKIFEDFRMKLKIKSYDIIHITSSASLGLLKDIVLLNIAKRHNIRTIIHFRFGRIPELSKSNNWEWKLLKYVVSHADTVITIDRSSYKTLLYYGFENIKLLPNPVSPHVVEYKTEHSSVKRIPRYIYFAGHCVATKGIFELVDACKKIENIHLKISGTISDDVKLKLIERAENREWLEITGNQSYEQVLEDMNKCDVFVLPSYTEGFPNVILESMAMSCSIVTTNVGAIPEMLESEAGKEYGIIVNPKNVDELYQGIQKMLTDQTFKENCASNVVERVNERYNMSLIWSMMVNIWFETINKDRI